MKVLLKALRLGTNTSEFGLYLDSDGFSTLYKTVTKEELITGVLDEAIPDGTTIIRVTSTVDCTNSVDIPVT